MSPEGWNGLETAQQYDAFVQRFPMYRETSADLVQHLEIGDDARVLDLACGTGVTTGVLLERLGDRGSVWAVDGSEPMLSMARHRILDSRVHWRVGLARDVVDLVDGGLDAGICNSAIWQLGDLSSVFAALRMVLRAGGQFACNWGESFVDDVPPDGARPPVLPIIEVARSRGIVPDDRPTRQAPVWSRSARSFRRSKVQDSGLLSSGG